MLSVIQSDWTQSLIHDLRQSKYIFKRFQKKCPRYSTRGTELQLISTKNYHISQINFFNRKYIEKEFCYVIG